ncbi:MAG: fibronectin type III domain-containing protein [Deltaproteobacteria bacterium]|nr:fibronectin type III domain-containing protein [Deltaproteobacteria bacterium]
MLCSQRGPAITVTVPPYTPPVPPTPRPPFWVFREAINEVEAYVRIDWCKVPGATRYEVEVKGLGLVYNGPGVSGKGIGSTTVYGLRPGTEYLVRVRACNESGCSPWSSWASIHTPYSGWAGYPVYPHPECIPEPT